MSEDLFKKIVSLCKRRGFVYPGSEIYGGLANTYDYGPLGVELLRNIQNSWWDHFVTKRSDIYGLNSAIIMSPKVWEASGHTQSFTDSLVDCKKCQNRMRADHLIENYFSDKEVKVEGLAPEDLNKMIREEKIACPKCGKFDWTPPREFNLLFETQIGIVPESQSLAYLRGEIAQGMFVNFKQVLDSVHPELPFGLAQSGPAFRNEVTLGNFIFRTLQFNLSELEYFFNHKETDWEVLFGLWKDEVQNWATEVLGLNKKMLRWRSHTDDERSHYSTKTEDLDFKFPFGFKEMFAVAYRTDFDLKMHMEKTGVDMRYTDRKTNEKILPHVMEPTFGMDRAFLAALFNGYTEDGDRVILKLSPQIAPYKVAVFPLLSNKEELVGKAREVFKMLQKEFSVAWDSRGNIGKRYYAQDEIGTLHCVTIDFDSLEDSTVTIRDRDSGEQVRVAIDKLVETIGGLVKGEVNFKDL